MKRNDIFIIMSIKSDLMRVAQQAGRLNYPESYKLWIAILENCLNKLNSLPQNKQNKLIKSYLKKLILPKKKVLYDLKSRLKWAEKVLDVSCMI